MDDPVSYGRYPQRSGAAVWFGYLNPSDWAWFIGSGFELQMKPFGVFMEDFPTLNFLENCENIVFLGSCGVGKTFLATALGIEEAKHGHSAYFIKANDLFIIHMSLLF